MKGYGGQKGLLHKQQNKDMGKCGIRKRQRYSSLLCLGEEVKTGLQESEVPVTRAKSGAMKAFSQWRKIGLRNT